MKLLVAISECPPAMLLMTAHPNPAGSTLCGHEFAFLKKPIDREPLRRSSCWSACSWAEPLFMTSGSVHASMRCAGC